MKFEIGYHGYCFTVHVRNNTYRSFSLCLSLVYTFFLFFLAVKQQ